jgi:hypothetical protein
MEKSESIKELATALAKAQSELENATKDTENQFFKSKYADLATILNTCRPVLSKHGLSVMQLPSYLDGIASVDTLIMHASGEWIRGVSSAPVSKLDPQGVGSATTYLRRYAYAAAAGIAQEDDDGNAASKKEAVKKPQHQTVAKEAFDRMNPEEQAQLQEIAAAAQTFIFDGAVDDAVVMIDNLNLDADAKTGLWALFNSSERAALKKASSALRATS